jgi:hypothetical protein
VIDESIHRMEPESSLEVGVAPSFAECAPNKVASKSMTTSSVPQTDEDNCHTAAGAAGRSTTDRRDREPLPAAHGADAPADGGAGSRTTPAGPAPPLDQPGNHHRVCDRDRQIQDRFARIMDRARCPPRRRLPRQIRPQAAELCTAASTTHQRRNPATRDPLQPETRHTGYASPTERLSRFANSDPGQVTFSK